MRAALAALALLVVPSAARAQTVAPPGGGRPDPRPTETAPRDPATAVPQPRDRPPQPGPDLFPRDALGSAVGWELAPEPAPSDPSAAAEEELDR
jgi:hypothetical protein